MEHVKTIRKDDYSAPKLGAMHGPPYVLKSRMWPRVRETPISENSSVALLSDVPNSVDKVALCWRHFSFSTTISVPPQLIKQGAVWC